MVAAESCGTPRELSSTDHPADGLAVPRIQQQLN